MEEKKGTRIEAKMQGTLQLGLEQNDCTSREKEEEIEDEIRSTGTEHNILESNPRADRQKTCTTP